MALGTVYGVNRTLTNVNVPSEKSGKGEAGGKIRVSFDSYVLPGAVIDAGDFVEMMTIPKGARIVDASISCASLGTTGILQLGTVADPDNLIVAADAGGQAVFAKATAGASGLFAALSVDTLFQLKCTEISTNTAVAISVAIYYILD